MLPPLQSKLGITALVGGFTAGSIDFSHVLATKLPLFIAIVVVLSALLLFVIFRSLVIPLQAAAMNLLSIGGALGAPSRYSRRAGCRASSAFSRGRSSHGSR